MELRIRGSLESQGDVHRLVGAFGGQPCEVYWCPEGPGAARGAAQLAALEAGLGRLGAAALPAVISRGTIGMGAALVLTPVSGQAIMAWRGFFVPEGAVQALVRAVAGVLGCLRAGLDDAGLGLLPGMFHEAAFVVRADGTLGLADVGRLLSKDGAVLGRALPPVGPGPAWPQPSAMAQSHDTFMLARLAFQLMASPWLAAQAESLDGEASSEVWLHLIDQLPGSVTAAGRAWLVQGLAWEAWLRPDVAAWAAGATGAEPGMLAAFAAENQGESSQQVDTGHFLAGRVLLPEPGSLPTAAVRWRLQPAALQTTAPRKRRRLWPLLVLVALVVLPGMWLFLRKAADLFGSSSLRRLEKWEAMDEPSPAAAGDTGQGDGRININRASMAELESLPGIGPAKAAAITSNRDQRGPFSSCDDLARVAGIGPATVAMLRAHCRTE